MPDVAVLGATVAGLTASRRLASAGFDVVVLDPHPAVLGLGHGVAAAAQTDTVVELGQAYGSEVVTEHVRRSLAGLDEIRRVAAAGGVETSELRLHDHSLGVALEAELRPVVRQLRAAGAEVQVMTSRQRGLSTPGVVSDALVLDPAAYAVALEQQAATAGARIVRGVTVTHLRRRDRVTQLLYRHNLALDPGMQRLSAAAVIDTLGVSPWGRTAAVGAPQVVPVVRFRPKSPLTRVTLLAGPPVWMLRPWGEDAVAVGPKCAPERAAAAVRDLETWLENQLEGVPVSSSAVTIDPSDHGRPVVGASAIPGGYYARGNGRDELINGTASGCYLAGLLMGIDVPHRVALSRFSRLRARTLGHRRNL